MKVIISHPTGNANVRAIAKGFATADKLHRFYTSIACFPKSGVERLGNLPGFSELKRRNFDRLLQPFTHTFPWTELGRMISNKTGFRSLTAHETGFFSVDRVYHSLDKHVAGKLAQSGPARATTVYAYEDGALETFKQAKLLGLTCVYDLPIAHWKMSRQLMTEEAERLPHWAKTLGGGIADSNEKLDRKNAELDLADIIVTPGSFVAHSLNGVINNQKIILSPFGSPSITADGAKWESNVEQPLRVLFAGSLGQRKGLADLFEAIKILNTKHIELIILGSLLEDLSFYKKELSSLTYEPTRSHAEVLALMRSCDVFCLPSIVEGRALVIQEAMSQCLPIIITPNTGGEDLVIEGRTGFLVPIRNPWAIAEKLQWFLDNRHRIADMGNYARQHASGYSWDKYAADIISEIECFLMEKAL